MDVFLASFGQRSGDGLDSVKHENKTFKCIPKFLCKNNAIHSLYLHIRIYIP